MTIIFIGNYPPDQQESMERFTCMLERGFRRGGVQTAIWRPRALLGKRIYNTNSGVRKWVGYLDKWILFPLILRWRLCDSRLHHAGVRFHVCDHSNAPYLRHLPPARTAITCHDVLAIRGAMGHKDAYSPASRLGRLLQRWILYHLSSSRLLVSVSRFTLDQLLELSNTPIDKPKKWSVIHNALNADFHSVNKSQRECILREAGLNPGTPFLLHVGSDSLRKNRRLLLDMVWALEDKWNGSIYFAGQRVEPTLLDHADKLGLKNRVVSVVKPDHNLLAALYSSCEAFIFPSFSEGFGWPVIEAQACGVPVIASNVGPMLEVSGGAALHADPANPREFALAFLSLKDESVREDLIRRGYQNILRFREDKIMKAYFELHQI